MERGPLALKIQPPVTPRQIAKAEAQLGFRLPALLRDIYLKVANGGFGPGTGLFGLASSTHAANEFRAWTLAGIYTSFRYRSHRVRWDEKLLPICTWGCTYFSYLDCALPQAPVMLLDENSHGHGPWDCALALQGKSFEEWMRRWLDGEDLWESVGLYGEPKFAFEEEAEDHAPVRLSRNYGVAPEAVFDAWLTPRVARRWLFKGPNFTFVRIEMNARVGGRYSVRLNHADKEIDYSGVYEVIERPHRLVFSVQVPALFKDASRVSIDIAPAPRGSRLDLTHTGLPGRVLIGPWNYMLDTLGRVLTDRQGKSKRRSPSAGALVL